MSDHDELRHANHLEETRINEVAAQKVMNYAIPLLNLPRTASELQRAEQALVKAYRENVNLHKRIDLVLALCRNEWRKRWQTSITEFVESVDSILSASVIPAICPLCGAALPAECGQYCPTCQRDMAREIHDNQVLHDALFG